MIGRMGRDRMGFDAVEAAAKGRLWSRGLSLAEAAIGEGLEPAGRWGRSKDWRGTSERGAALVEEPGFAAVAA